MKLEKMTLKNYRCFESLEISFHNRLTVIVGSNGSGKTSVLEGATVALGTFFSELEGIKDISISRKDVRLVAYSMGETDDVQTQYPVEIRAEGEADGKHIVWKRALNGEGNRTTKKEAQEMIEISAAFQMRLQEGDKPLILPLISYYGIGRLWDYHREKKSDTFKNNTKTNGYLDSLSGTANIKLMMNWFRKKTVQAAQNNFQGGRSAELSAVYGAMEECYKLVTGFQDVKIQYNLDSNELNCSYRDERDNTMTIPLSQLSDGYKGTISLIADIAYRMAVLNPQLGSDVIKQTDGVVLIDEVDLHLHPTWQHRILSDLQNIFPKIQFIVTTHAPAVISSAKSENLVILNHNEATDAVTESFGNDANSILRDIMGTSERNPTIAKLFRNFYELLEAKNFDEAERILDEIDEQRDYHDTEVAGCRVKLRLERIRRGQNDRS